MDLSPNPYSSPQVAEQTAPDMVSRPRGDGVAFGLTAIMLSVAILTLLTCACGHLSSFALPATGICFGLAVLARRENRNGLTLVAFGVSFFVLAKNLADVLLTGHDPILQLFR